MKILFVILTLVLSLTLAAQKVDFSIHNISLSPEISYYDNQFSGLYIKNNNLFLMSECRLQDSAEAKLYSISLAVIERQLADSSYIFPIQNGKFTT